MAETLCVAVDAMGGDNAPSVVVEGVKLALAEDENLHIILCGPEEVVKEAAEGQNRLEAVATTQVISMAEHPAQAVRRKKDSSMVVAARMVKEGRAQGFFTAGNTGAALAAGTLVIGRIKGIYRPALATLIPSPVRPVIMCDVGANAECKPEYLVQFAQMGSIYAKYMLGIENPRVALLNIGEEAEKGSSFTQEAYALMSERLDNFAGNAEGRDILAATYDVIVTDGFTGNVCIKTIEGTSKVLFSALKEVFYHSFITKMGALTVSGELNKLKDKVNPDSLGGAPLLGVKGVVSIGHGSSNARAIKNGITVCESTVKAGISEIIQQNICGDDTSITMGQEKACE